MPYLWNHPVYQISKVSCEGVERSLAASFMPNLSAKGRNPKKISTKIVKMSLSEEGGVVEIP